MQSANNGRPHGIAHLPPATNLPNAMIVGLTKRKRTTGRKKTRSAPQPVSGSVCFRLSRMYSFRIRRTFSASVIPGGSTTAGGGRTSLTDIGGCCVPLATAAGGGVTDGRTDGSASGSASRVASISKASSSAGAFGVPVGPMVLSRYERFIVTHAVRAATACGRAVGNQGVYPTPSAGWEAPLRTTRPKGGESPAVAPVYAAVGLICTGAQTIGSSGRSLLTRRTVYSDSVVGITAAVTCEAALRGFVGDAGSHGAVLGCNAANACALIDKARYTGPMVAEQGVLQVSPSLCRPLLHARSAQPPSVGR